MIDFHPDASTSVPLSLTNYFGQAGLVDCDDRGYNSHSGYYGPKGGPDWNKREQNIVFAGMKQVLKGIFLTGGVDGLRTQQEVDELTAKLREALSGPKKFHLPTVRAWGRKPT